MSETTNRRKKWAALGFAGLALLALCACGPRNHPPEVTWLRGPTTGETESTYTFEAAASDLDGDSIALGISWGDTNDVQWSYNLPGGDSFYWNKAWSVSGDYALRARARDTKAALSDWSAEHVVTIVNKDSLRRLPPTTPVGPDQAYVGFILEFTCITRGPAGESGYVDIDWGDSSWSTYPADEPGAIGETLHAWHAFLSPGDYYVRACIDEWEVWSPSHLVTVTNASGNSWVQTYPGWMALSAASIAGGDLIFTGALYNDSGAFLGRTDAAGNPIWLRQYGQDSIWFDGMSVRQTADGGIVTVGAGNGPWSLGGIYILRTDKAGTIAWHREYHYQGEGEWGTPWGSQIRQTSDGGYIIAAGQALMKTDSAGDSLWTKPDSAWSVEITSDGGYILGCGSLLKTDAEGDEQWRTSFGEAGIGAARISSDGSYIIAGSSFGGESGEDSAYLARVSPSGSLVWQRKFGGLFGADGFDVSLTPDGGCYLVGMTGDPYEGDIGYLVRTDANGNLVWQRVLGQPVDDVRDLDLYWSCNSVVTASDGGCVVAGSEGDSTALFKVGQNGDLTAAAVGRGVRSRYHTWIGASRSRRNHDLRPRTSRRNPGGKH